MGVGAGLYMCDVVKKFTFAISSPDEFLYSKVMFKVPPHLIHVATLRCDVSLSIIGAYMFQVVSVFFLAFIFSQGSVARRV